MFIKVGFLLVLSAFLNQVIAATAVPVNLADRKARIEFEAAKLTIGSVNTFRFDKLKTKLSNLNLKTRRFDVQVSPYTGSGDLTFVNCGWWNDNLIACCDGSTMYIFNLNGSTSLPGFCVNGEWDLNNN